MNIKPLSDKDILKIFDNKINVILYDDLYKYNNINEILNKNNRAIILYIFESNIHGGKSGHWVSLRKYKRSILFFDSFGNIPDTQIKDIPIQQRIKLNEDKLFLTNLIKNNNYDIEYNEKIMQDDLSVVCGYYCVLFCALNYSMKDFQKIFSNDKIKNDKLVYKLVNYKK